MLSLVNTNGREEKGSSRIVRCDVNFVFVTLFVVLYHVNLAFITFFSLLYHVNLAETIGNNNKLDQVISNT